MLLSLEKLITPSLSHETEIMQAPLGRMDAAPSAGANSLSLGAPDPDSFHRPESKKHENSRFSYSEARVRVDILIIPCWAVLECLLDAVPAFPGGYIGSWPWS
jgi:hypothetical protein